MIDVNIPSRYVDICEHWHSGQNDLMYAVSSTGDLSIGNQRPFSCYTDEQWQLDILSTLWVDVNYAKRMAARAKQFEDESELGEFCDWITERLNELANEYCLADWLESR